MKLSSFFRKRKRQGRTLQTGFSNYKNPRLSNKKPVKRRKLKRSERPADRQARRTYEKRGRFFAIVKLIFLSALVIGFFYTILFTRLFEIQKIDIQSSAELLEEQSAVTEYLQEYLGENLIFFNARKHGAILTEKYPHLKKIKVKRTPLHSLLAIIEPFERIANLEVRREDGGKLFYIVNEMGFIASIGTTDASLPTLVMDVTGTDLDLPEDKIVTVNQEIIPAETLLTLLETKIAFEGKFNMQILETHFLKRARELHLYTGRHFFVWIDLTQSVDDQLSKLKKSLTELNIYEKELEYIDLRISGQNGEKVIYK